MLNPAAASASAAFVVRAASPRPMLAGGMLLRGPSAIGLAGAPVSVSLALSRLAATRHQ